jgi:hypothetical protein
MKRPSRVVAAGAASVESYVDGQGPAVVIIPSYGRDGGAPPLPTIPTRSPP